MFAKKILHIENNFTMKKTLRKYRLASLCYLYTFSNPQQIIADLCDVSVSLVSRWWRLEVDDPRSIDSDHLRKIADFFSVDMEYMYNKPTHKPQETA